MNEYNENYLKLCKSFEERAKQAKLFSDDSENDCLETEDEFTVPNSFYYIWITGKKSNSELMFDMEEEMLYVSNGKIIARDQAEAFTCYIKNCTGRVYLKPNGIAYKVNEHSIQHGSMYKTFVEFECRSQMRDECKTAGASKTITDIFEEAVVR